MRTWITSRTGVLGLTGIITLGACLALLSAIAAQGLSIRTVAGSLLVISFLVFMFGGMLFTGRAFLKWPGSETRSYLLWERGLVIAAILETTLGLVLLSDLLRAAGDIGLAQLGAVGYLFGAVIVVVAETAFLGKGDWVYPQVVLYVVVAFLAQAAIGASLLQTGLTAGWVGGFAVIWNLGVLLILLVVRPRDVYYPVLHHVAPLVIGIALLLP